MSSHHNKHAKLPHTTTDTVSTLRALEVYESAYNAGRLSQNHWNFQIAKSVSTGTDSTVQFNVVWESKAIAPRTTIEWKDQYGLNWTNALPDPGVSVTVGGEWQACDLGQVFDIDSTGFWSASQVAKEVNFMKVGNVNYNYPGTDGLHIVVGIKNSGGNFDAIFVDPTSLPLNSTASYQPQESIQWWYETGMKTATMISTASTSIGMIDFSQPAPTTNEFYYSTTFNYNSGSWITSEDDPPSILYAPPQDAPELQNAPSQLFSIWSSIWKGILTVVIGKEKQALVEGSLKSLLQVQYQDVEVKFIDNLHIKIELGTPKHAKQNSNDAIGAPTDDVEAVISDCLQYLLDDQVLPPGETWTIEKALTY